MLPPISCYPLSYLFFHALQMKYQEEFFHNQIESIHSITEAKEEEFEKLLQEERAKARRFDVDSGTTEDRRLRWVTNSQLDGALCHSFYLLAAQFSLSLS